MKRKPSLAALRRRLDKVFAAWIRKRDHGKPCITCGKRTELQAGHFIKRQHMLYRWNEANVNGQCARCNLWLHGNEGVYALQLVKMYGDDVIRTWISRKHTVVKYSRSDLEEMIRKYTP